MVLAHTVSMANVLTDSQVTAYDTDGYVFPIPALSGDEVARCRAGLEQYEASVGHPIEFPEKSKSYLLFDWADELVHHPKVLDAVESECPPEAGPVRIIPGSHRLGQFEHGDDPGQWNMIKRGQGIFDQFKDDDGVLMPLRSGEMSLHHTDVVHSSTGNNATDRRIGIGISYIPTRVRPLGDIKPSALLVRGTDTYGHFVEEDRLIEQQSPEALAAHVEANRLFRARQDAGASLS
jgi:non-haem Fe2+, alpha-ketoglutarate-dependent halogenase